MDLLGLYLGVPEGYEILYLPTEAGIPSIPFNLTKFTQNQAIYIVSNRET